MNFIFRALYFLVLSTSYLLSSNIVSQQSLQDIPEEVLRQMSQASPSQQRIIAQRYGIDLSEDNQNPETVLGNPGIPLTLETTQQINQDDLEKPSEQIFELDLKDKPSNRFGLDFFRQEITTFAPVDDMPIPQNYILGVGDQLIIQLIGTENRRLTLEVDRNGAVVFDSIGSINIAGSSFEAASEIIKSKVNQELFGVEALITLGRLKAMNIFMTGEVLNPGMYSVSSLTSVTQALYQAGGISDIGSLRNIQVLRQNKLINVFDAYDLLIYGDSSGDIRLKSGDILFVPPYQGLASVSGAVKRPKLFEIKNNENVSDLLSMAGGYLSNAYPEKASLVTSKAVGRTPQVFSIDLINDDATNFYIFDGADLNIPSLNDGLSKYFKITGASQLNGNFGWKEGIRISDIFNDLRKDFQSDTDFNFSVLVREKSSTRDIETYAFSLFNAINSPESSDNIVLQEFDEILIFSKEIVEGRSQNKNTVDLVNTVDDLLEAENTELESDLETLENPISDNIDFGRDSLLRPVIKKLRAQSDNNNETQLVTISGAVPFPGVYPLFKNATAQTLINAGGGFLDSSFTRSVEVRRLETINNNEIRTFYSELNLSDKQISNDFDFKLSSRDHMTVRQISNWNDIRQIVIDGAVMFPGKYIITDQDKLSDVIERAGGFRGNANPKAAIFTKKSIAKEQKERAKIYAQSIRQTLSTKFLTEETISTSFDDVEKITSALENYSGIGRLVIDLPKIIQDTDSNDKLDLEDGDALYIPVVSNFITVVGEVNQPNSITINDTFRVEDYIIAAGGLSPRADEENIFISKANGSTVLLDQAFWKVGGRRPVFESGDAIIVPIKASYKDSLENWTEITQLVYQTMVSLAAVKGL